MLHSPSENNEKNDGDKKIEITNEKSILPIDVWKHISSFLSIKDNFMVSQVNRFFYNQINFIRNDLTLKIFYPILADFYNQVIIKNNMLFNQTKWVFEEKFSFCYLLRDLLVSLISYQKLNDPFTIIYNETEHKGKLENWSSFLTKILQSPKESQRKFYTYRCILSFFSP